MTTTEQKQDLHLLLVMLLSEIEALSPATESLEWYLINQIKMFVSTLENAKSGQDVENCTGVFSRFCTESMDWDSDLYKRCTEITALGFRLAKQ